MRQNPRAGKTRKVLLDMRTALLEKPTAKSMRANDKKFFFASKFCSIQNES